VHAGWHGGLVPALQACTLALQASTLALASMHISAGKHANELCGYGATKGAPGTLDNCQCWRVYWVGRNCF
jgi:hypothetical protein